MPRKPRFDVTDLPQHVIQRGNNRQSCFHTDSDYRVYLEHLRAACDAHGCVVHAYVLMTNHVHLLVTQTRVRGLSRTMQCLGRRYVKYVNDVYRRTGTLWEGRYKASLVSCDAYLFACYRYIELNPVRAGMVEHPGGYRWSSYRCNAEGIEDALVSAHETYLSLGSDGRTRRRRYCALFRSDLEPDMISEIRACANSDLVFGNERFKDEIEQALGRRARPGKSGRPKKTDPDEQKVSQRGQRKIGL